MKEINMVVILTVILTTTTLVMTAVIFRLIRNITAKQRNEVSEQVNVR